MSKTGRAGKMSPDHNGFRIGRVYVQSDFAGLISETEEGYKFQYSLSYLRKEDAVPISLTMPFQEEPYLSHTLFPFFDGLIPEGWLLSVVSRNWKIDRNDRFGLMLASCRDCIGDVRIEPEESI